MGLLDIFKSKKQRKVEEKLKRPSKGALKTPAQSPKGIEAGKPSDKKEETGGVKAGKSELASRIILSPHVTEKTTVSSERGVYAFRVSPRANKVMISRAIKEMYGFKPKKISILNMPSKTRVQRGRTGHRPGYKKAVIYLNKGEKIELA